MILSALVEHFVEERFGKRSVTRPAPVWAPLFVLFRIQPDQGFTRATHWGMAAAGIRVPRRATHNRSAARCVGGTDIFDAGHKAPPCYHFSALLPPKQATGVADCLLENRLQGGAISTHGNERRSRRIDIPHRLGATITKNVCGTA